MPGVLSTRNAEVIETEENIRRVIEGCEWKVIKKDCSSTVWI